MVLKGSRFVVMGMLSRTENKEGGVVRLPLPCHHIFGVFPMAEMTATAISPTSENKSPRRRVSKSPRKPSDKSIKKGIYLTLENARRLQVTSAFDFRSDSDIINELIERHLRGLVVSDRRTTSESEPFSLPSHDTKSANSVATL